MKGIQVSDVLALNDGLTMPQFGLGVWQIPNAELPEVVAQAITMGYRLIDGAFIYENESGMGEGIRQSAIAREALFITSKVWNSEQGYDRARSAIDASLKRIGVDYLDLCLIHWPCPVKNQYVETWRALIDAQRDGLIKSVGVSNFNADHLDRLISETGITPAVNQIEINPCMQQREMRAINAERGIVTQSWTPLGNGASFQAPALQAISERLGATPAQVILAWHRQLGLAVAVRSSNRARLQDNLNAVDFQLSDADMRALGALHTGERCGPDPEDFEVE